MNVRVDPSALVAEEVGDVDAMLIARLAATTALSRRARRAENLLVLVGIWAVIVTGFLIMGGAS